MDPGSGGGGGGGGGGSSSGSSSSDSAPDCWDQADMEAPGPGPCGGAGGPLAAAAAEAQREHLSAAFSRQLNVNAKPFVPNVHAAEFVPSFLRGPAQPSAPPAGAAANNHGAGSGAGGPSGKRPGRRSFLGCGRKPGGEERSSRPGSLSPPGMGIGVGSGARQARGAWSWGQAARGELTAAPAVLGGAPRGQGGGLRRVAAVEGRAGWEQRAGHTTGAEGPRPAAGLFFRGAPLPRWKWGPYGTEGDRRWTVPRGLEMRTDGA